MSENQYYNCNLLQLYSDFMYSQKYWYLEKFDVTTKLSKDEIIQMDRAMIIKKVDKNTVVTFPEMQENYVYFLKEGIIKIMNVADDGNEMIKYIITSGNIFGELALLENQESENDYAVAVNDCVVCFMETSVLKMMMENNSKMATYVRKLVGLRIRKIERRLESIIFKDSTSRVKEFLIDFAREYGKQKDDGIYVKNFLTHDDIAKITATSRQTVTSVFNDLRKNGILEYNSKEMIIPIGQVKLFLEN